MLTRVLAVLAATAMIIAAFAIRSARDGGDQPESGDFVLVCDEILEDVCAAVDGDGVRVTVEPAATTADRIAGLDRDAVELGAWLTAGPWPAMVNAARDADGREPLFRTDPIAATPLALVAEIDSDQIPQCIAEAPNWRCIADAAASGFRLSAPPQRSSLRLLGRAAVASGYFEGDFARNDLVERADVVSSIKAVDRRIEESRRSGGATLELLVANPAFADGFVTTSAEGNRLLQVAANSSRFALVTPGDPPVFVTATLGTLAGSSRPLIREDLFPIFERLGWQKPVAEDGLPSPGVLHALREIFG